MALADEILDYVGYGLTRADAAQELAEVIDEHYADLVQAARNLIADAAHRQGAVDAHSLAQLQRILAEYQPFAAEPANQPDLFSTPG